MEKREKTIICHIATSLKNGGAEAILYRLCIMTKQKYSHHIFCLTEGGEYLTRLENAGLDVRTYKIGSSVKNLWILYKDIKYLRPDVVHCWLYYADAIGGIFAKISHVKKIIWGLHNGEVSCRFPVVKKLNGFLSYVIPTRIIAVSKAAKEYHAKYYKYSLQKIDVIYNGVDLGRFKPNQTVRKTWREKMGVECNTVLVGMIARVVPEKNHDMLISAIKTLVQRGLDIKCVLVGMGVERLKLDDQYFISFEHIENVNVIMNALDVNILCSRSEGFGNVVAEAMACGVPSIVSNIEPLRSIVRGVGFVIEKDVLEQNGDDVAQCICSVYSLMKNDRIAWEKLKRANRKTCTEKYSLNRMVKSYVAVWEM